MANIKLLQEAIQAFAGGESKLADSKMRKFFVEQAQEINKKFEDEMNEELEQNPETDMEDDISFDFDDGKGPEGWVAYDDDINEAADEEEDQEPVEDPELDPELGDEAVADGEVQAEEQDTWAEIHSAFEELEQLFNEIENQEHSEEESEEVQADDEAVADDDFDGVDFGDESVRESSEHYKDVKNVKSTEEADVNDKSPTAKRAKSIVPGIDNVVINDGDVEDLTSDSNKPMKGVKVEQPQTTVPSALRSMKKSSVPSNKAEKSASPLARHK